MPAPTTHTSADSSLITGMCRGTSAAAYQTGSAWPDGLVSVAGGADEGIGAGSFCGLMPAVLARRGRRCQRGNPQMDAGPG
jgi:hypothetical protein